MAELSPDDFAAYFEAIHGAAPFPWQARLLADVAREGGWPTLLDLPTGAGKTAAIDVALFHLALDAAAPPAQRTAPRRIVMVVDRRTVVDQAFERAKKIAETLTGAGNGVLRAVADRLRALAGLRGNEAPLALAQLRGGMPRDDAWARRPDQPLVAVSTVDQVGSRLLFRGYGVSDAMRPIHAGLLGNDTLLLLDEVHLSQPFRETLRSLCRYRTWTSRKLPDRWQVVEMSATPGSTAGTAGVTSAASDDGRVFGLNDDDRRDERLARRLQANKPAALAEVKVSGGEGARRAALAEACAEHALRFVAPGRAVGVIVNRVATAREAAEAIRKRSGGSVDPILVTGRMRPLDRDDLDERLGPLVRTGRARDAAADPVVIVATQCIEAGADFDLDAIVTECASIDALRQRFGRLNRIGAIEDARGVVLVRSDALAKDYVDPVYGNALAATWTWLGEATRDFGIQEMAAALPEGARLEAMLSQTSRAPVMLPAHLDAWVQTRPSPEVDPDVSLWLHGTDQEHAPEVQVVWRADVTGTLLAQAKRDEEAREALLKRVEACAPVGLEAISLPIHAVRAWLQGGAAPELADIEGRAMDDDEGDRHDGRLALLWKGDESRVIEPGELCPGSTLVVPGTYGGLAGGTWDPSSQVPVSDLGDRARWQQTGRPTLRLHPDVMRQHAGVTDAALPKIPVPVVDERSDAQDRAEIDAWLSEMSAATAATSWLGQVITALAVKGRRRPALVRLDGMELVGEDGAPRVEEGYFALVGRFRARVEGAGDVTTEDDGASYTGVEVTLREHLGGVASWARRFAEQCGLPPEVARAVELAARWHDAGKVDPRFQRMLHGGSELRAAVAPEPLAKSALVAADRAARAHAIKRSGYPRGARHELSSVALLQGCERLFDKDVDRDLVLHLTASHHGWCRPFAPVVADDEPVELALEVEGTPVRVSSDHGLARLDAGIAERFWRLVQRYGWFGLAWLEALLRLADHRRSEEEQRGDIGARDDR
ncbi:type I-U CRISPR-associated helicase/endonuclease Cas3 [Sorangium cellulosum]|uniref:Type I-U CRISPR-associated helicase/endonuclease Cas3 n=1 Tax=Sorangium cellulosum TaxID=56 RepID=A0A150PMN4_SORCE|nr:type I-U CRISPR-associated helicase/endonuclease Cas3 [Sorangium cellulosum]